MTSAVASAGNALHAVGVRRAKPGEAGSFRLLGHQPQLLERAVRCGAALNDGGRDQEWKERYGILSQG